MQDEDLGSLGGGLQEPPEDEELTRPGGPQSAPVLPQPINQATMVCLRGPCVHFWRLLLRFAAASEGVLTERSWTCLASNEEFALTDGGECKMVYFCDRWWPRAPYHQPEGDEDTARYSVDASLAFSSKLPDIPQSRRPALHRAWEACLKADGYDFSWRDFDPETLGTDDDPHQRKFNAPGGLEAAREAQAQEGLPPASSVPEDD
jgi:hypothetical protein